MKTKVYTVLLILGFTVSCTESDQAIENITIPAESETEVVYETKTPHDLEKNDGRKWKISKGMEKPLKKIKKLVKSYEGTELVDYQLLGDAIGKQTNKVISNCKMSGQAHDELHKWLLPFLDLKEALVMTSSPEGGEAILEHIKIELHILDDYFK
ncbi:MAG: hypothetical protein AB8B72_04710 [Crocinitomicaceae bacterium]